MSETLSQDQIDAMLREIDLTTLSPELGYLTDPLTPMETVRASFLDSPRFHCPKCQVPTKRARFTRPARQIVEIISDKGQVIGRLYIPSTGVICLKCGNKYSP